MRIWINGKSHELPDPASVHDVLTALGAPSTGWPSRWMTSWCPGRTVRATGGRRRQVEVLTAVQGG